MDGTVESEEQKNPMAPSKRSIADINGSQRVSIQQTPEIKKRVPAKIDDDDLDKPIRDFIKERGKK